MSNGTAARFRVDGALLPATAWREVLDGVMPASAAHRRSLNRCT